MSKAHAFSGPILVTGATGYIGSNLVRRLVADGCEVHVVVRRGSRKDIISSDLGAITFHEHDGSANGLVNIIGVVKPFVVYHLASRFLAQHSAADLDDLISSNILFSTQLVEAMVQHGVVNLINTGTSWQHYENQGYMPVNLYAATKQAFESILTYYTEVCHLKVISLKLFDTYGPKDPRAKLIHLLWKTALTKQPISMSPGEQLIDMVYIDDVIDAFVLAGSLLHTQSEAHCQYGVSSGAPLPLKTLVGEFERATGYSLPINWGARSYRSREVMVPWNTFKSLPGWQARIPFEVGVNLAKPLNLSL